MKKLILLLGCIALVGCADTTQYVWVSYESLLSDNCIKETSRDEANVTFTFSGIILGFKNRYTECPEGYEMVRIPQGESMTADEFNFRYQNDSDFKKKIVDYEFL